MRTTTLGKALSCGALALLGCSRFEIENKPPVAEVAVIVNGTVVDPRVPIPFGGAPLSVTLDSSGSGDEDGMIVEYVWLQTDVAPNVRFAGNGMVDSGTLPPFSGDPLSRPSPQLTLGEGTYQYSLWVVDDEGGISEPAVVELTILTPES